MFVLALLVGTAAAQTILPVVPLPTSPSALPQWGVPGIVEGIATIFSQLSTQTQQQIKTILNDKSVTVSQLNQKLGNIVDKFTISQQNQVRSVIANGVALSKQVSNNVLDNPNASAADKSTFSQLASIFTNQSISLVDQCSQVKPILSTASASTLQTFGLSSSAAGINCDDLSFLLQN